jgi:4'-phosphopantetheinyl transferase
VRQALGQLLGVPAQCLTVIERTGQAPLLDLPGSVIPGFSISHTGNWVACAVSASTKLGLDIECIDATRDIPALAAQAFDADQRAWLAARPESTRMRDFYQMWSQAEARIKLGGHAAYEAALFHPEFAAALCSAHPLAEPPGLQLATLAD